MSRPTAEEISAKSARNRAARMADPRTEALAKAMREPRFAESILASNQLAYPSERLGARFKKTPTVSDVGQRERQSIAVTLPYPPSVNHYWLPNANHSKRISDKGNQFRAEVIHACRGHDGVMGRISVSVIANPPDRRKRDLDNIFKALLDALNHAGMIEDDGLIDRLLIERGKVFESGQVRVTIEPLPSPSSA